MGNDDDWNDDNELLKGIDDELISDDDDEWN